jgi:hypothetical protein
VSGSDQNPEARSSNRALDAAFEISRNGRVDRICEITHKSGSVGREGRVEV